MVVLVHSDISLSTTSNSFSTSRLNTDFG